jgi:hypothetical protein
MPLRSREESASEAPVEDGFDRFADGRTREAVQPLAFAGGAAVAMLHDPGEKLGDQRVEFGAIRVGPPRSARHAASLRT